MSISSNQIKLLFVAKGKLRWTEDTFRYALAQIAGVSSVKDLDRAGFEAMMGYFEYRGFAPLAPRGASYGERPGMASFAQIELIREMWHEHTHGKAGEEQLNRWLERCWKISSLRFLKSDVAPKVITALKAMKARAA